MQTLLWVGALLLVGLAVMVLEVFVPSGGALGLLSLVAIGAAIVMAFMATLKAALKSAMCSNSRKLSLMSTAWSPSAKVSLLELREEDPTFVLLKCLSLRLGLAGLCMSYRPLEVMQPAIPTASKS